MRIIAAASLVFTLALASAAGQGASRNENDKRPTSQAIFRFDTFGDEQLWTGVLRMHEVIQRRRRIVHHDAREPAGNRSGQRFYHQDGAGPGVSESSEIARRNQKGQ